MTLKVNISADTDDTGCLAEIKGRNVASVDASACSDEAQAIAEAAAFMERMDMQRLKVRYGLGTVELRKDDVLGQKAQELFYASCCFNLYEIDTMTLKEYKFGDPGRACDIATAAHSALRISKHFGKKVSFKFNGVALPPVEQKEEITSEHIRAVVDNYTKASDKRPRC